MKILFFSSARTAAGCAADEIFFGAPASLDEVWRGVIEKHPALAPLRRVSRLSRNDAYADDQAVFHDTDVVAVIPPVSGG